MAMPKYTGAFTLSVDPVPLVHVRDEDGEIIHSLRFATRTGDGTIVVDQYAARLHFFASDGTFLRSVGERAQGPGEFDDIRWAGNCASDSLYVWDYMARKVVVFDESGTFAREFRPRSTTHEIGCSRPSTFAALGLRYEFLAFGEEGRTLAPAWIMDGEGAVLDTIPLVPFIENRPLGKMTRIAVSGEHLFVGTAEGASVDVFDLTGTYVRSVEAGVGARAPDQANSEASMEAMLSVAPDRQIRDRFRDMYRSLPVPEHMPPYFELRADPMGVLWAVVSGPGDPVTTLHAVSAEGNLLGFVSLPGRVQIFEVGTDYILGALMGEMDVQELVMYRLRRKGGMDGR